VPVSAAKLVRQVSLLRFRLQNHDTIRVLERQTFQEKIVDQTKDGGVHADAERERKHGEKGEPGRLEELADGEAEINHGNFRISIFNFRLEESLGAEGEERIDASSAAGGEITGDERERA